MGVNRDDARVLERKMVAVPNNSRTGTRLMNLDRRSLLIATVLTAAVAGCGTRSSGGQPISTSSSHPGPDPTETFVLPYDKMSFETWAKVPPGRGEMATVSAAPNTPGPSGV